MKKIILVFLFMCSMMFVQSRQINVQAKPCTIGPNNCIVGEEPGGMQYLTAEQFFSTHVYKTENVSQQNLVPLFQISNTDEMVPYLLSISESIGNYYYYVDSIHYVPIGTDHGQYYIADGYEYVKFAETSLYVNSHYSDFYSGDSFYQLDETRNIHEQFMVYQVLLKVMVFEVVEIPSGNSYVPGQDPEADSIMARIESVLSWLEDILDRDPGTSSILITEFASQVATGQIYGGGGSIKYLEDNYE